MSKLAFVLTPAALRPDDVHLPTLTVGQTLDFALSTKTPGKRLPGTSPSEFRKQVLETTLKMLNISHTKDTVVGNQVRPLSPVVPCGCHSSRKAELTDRCLIAVRSRCLWRRTQACFDCRDDGRPSCRRRLGQQARPAFFIFG